MTDKPSTNLILINRTKIDRVKWYKFKELARHMNLSTEELLDKVVTSFINSHQIKVERIK